MPEKLKKGIYFESSILHDPTVNKELYRVMLPLPHQVNTGTREILLGLCSKISQGEILRQLLESLLPPDNKIQLFTVVKNKLSKIFQE